MVSHPGQRTAPSQSDTPAGCTVDGPWISRSPHAPRHVLYGDDIDYEQEFLYRQPRNHQDLRDVVTAMQEDPWAGWAYDGDTHWTPGLAREWWAERGRVHEWIASKHPRWSVSDHTDDREAATGLRDYPRVPAQRPRRRPSGVHLLPR
jgi:hypothetical protein